MNGHLGDDHQSDIPLPLVDCLQPETIPIVRTIIVATGASQDTRQAVTREMNFA
ncbi:MAG: hypothetical protein RL156_1207 [Bacteroidota bacterium]|jgi:hypothetical protein